MNPYSSLFPLTMPAAPADGVRRWSLTIDLPSAMCPRSGNPLTGSVLILTPEIHRSYPEVYAVAGCARDAAQELIGGFAGDDTRPMVRDMEGAVAHIARAVAVMLDCAVQYRAELRIAVQGGASVGLLVEGRIAL
jgi:hypothetical protein